MNKWFYVNNSDGGQSEQANDSASIVQVCQRKRFRNSKMPEERQQEAKWNAAIIERG